MAEAGTLTNLAGQQVSFALNSNEERDIIATFPGGQAAAAAAACNSGGGTGSGGGINGGGGSGSGCMPSRLAAAALSFTASASGLCACREGQQVQRWGEGVQQAGQ